MARRLCTNRRVLVASPAYLERRGSPASPAELSAHECVLFTGFAKPREWKLIGPEGPVSVSVSGRITTNNIDVVLAAARQGLGVTVGATLSVGPALLAGFRPVETGRATGGRLDRGHQPVLHGSLTFLLVGSLLFVDWAHRPGP